MERFIDHLEELLITSQTRSMGTDIKKHILDVCSKWFGKDRIFFASYIEFMSSNLVKNEKLKVNDEVNKVVIEKKKVIEYLQQSVQNLTLIDDYNLNYDAKSIDIFPIIFLYFMKIISLQKLILTLVTNAGTSDRKDLSSVDKTIASINKIKQEIVETNKRTVSYDTSQGIIEDDDTQLVSLHTSTKDQKVIAKTFKTYTPGLTYDEYKNCLSLLHAYEEDKIIKDDEYSKQYTTEELENMDQSERLKHVELRWKVLSDMLIPFYEYCNDHYVKTQKLGSMDSSEWKSIFSNTSKAVLYKSSSQTYDLQTAGELILNSMYVNVKLLIDNLQKILSNMEDIDIREWLENLKVGTSIDNTLYINISSKDEDLLKNMATLDRLNQLLLTIFHVDEEDNFDPVDWITRSTISRLGFVNMLVDVIGSHILNDRNGIMVVNDIYNVKGNESFIKKVDELIKLRSARSIITYTKVRNNVGVDDYNRRFNVLVNKEKDLLVVQVNEDDEPYYQKSDKNENMLSIVKENLPLNVEVKSEYGAYIDFPYLNDNTTALKQYDRSYVFGKFNKVFLPDEDNQKIAYQMDALVQSLLSKKIVFLIGYGASGAGKTSTLIYFNDKNNKVDLRKNNGVFIHLCDLLASKGFNHLLLWSKEFYVDPVENPINDISNDSIVPTVDSSPSENECYVFKKQGEFRFVGKQQLSDARTREDVAGQDVKHSNKHRYRSKGEEFSIFKQGTPLGEVVVHLVDKDRFVKATTNNPNSSRSHTIIFVELYDDTDTPARIAIGDFAGVENVFMCDELFIKQRFATVKRQGTDEYYYRQEAINRDGIYIPDPVHGGGENQFDKCQSSITSTLPLWSMNLEERRTHPTNEKESFLKGWYNLHPERYKTHASMVLNYVFDENIDKVQNIFKLSSNRVREKFEEKQGAFLSIVETKKNNISSLLNASDPTTLWQWYNKKHSEVYDKVFNKSIKEVLETKIQEIINQINSNVLKLDKSSNVFVESKDKLKTGFTRLIPSDYPKNPENLVFVDEYDDEYVTDGQGYTYKGLKIYYNCKSNTFYTVAVKKTDVPPPLTAKITTVTSLSRATKYNTDKANELCRNRDMLQNLKNSLKTLESYDKDIKRIKNNPLQEIKNTTSITVYSLNLLQGTLDVETTYETLKDDFCNALVDEINTIKIFVGDEDRIVYSSNEQEENVNDYVKNHLKSHLDTLLIDTQCLMIVYELVKDLMIDTACRLDYATYVCKNRRSEGYFINDSLRALRTAINRFLSVQVKKGVNLTPATAALCDDQYCKGQRGRRKCWKRDTSYEGEERESILMQQIYKDFFNTSYVPKENLDSMYNNMVLCVFCVFNISKDLHTNNPPPVPYIDINKLKRLFVQGESLDTLKDHYNFRRDMLLNYNVEKINPLIQSDAIKKMDDYVKNASKTGKKTNIVSSLYNNVFREIDNNNAASAIGTLEFIDQLSKFNSTDVVCSWNTSGKGIDVSSEKEINSIVRFCKDEDLKDVLDLMDLLKKRL